MKYVLHLNIRITMLLSFYPFLGTQLTPTLYKDLRNLKKWLILICLIKSIKVNWY
jgi:hypothetical protein